MTAILIENLSKTYPTSFPRLKKLLHLEIKPPVEALRNVSFAIEKNEIFGLIGRNGAGKTTLTKIIATLVQPTAGRISVLNFDALRDEVKVRSLIGLATAEERSFYWRLTAEQNLMFFSRLYGMTDAAARRRIFEIFEQLKMTELARRRFSELSTGNKQRLAIARAILPNPPILLLDEPTRSLDPLAAQDMRDLILSFKNHSILLTSHNLAEVEELCNRVAIISKGEIRAIDTPRNLRLQTKQTQRVKISARGNLSNEFLKEKLSSIKSDLTFEKNAETLVVKFEREADDEVLGDIVSLLTSNGATVSDIEIEKPTLLDVLESYE